MGSMNLLYLAHADEDHSAPVTEDSGFLSSLSHLPAWAAVPLILFVMFGLYALMEKLKIRPINRIMMLIPVTILFAILYLEHNPAVTTVLLSGGFIASFALAFILLSSPQAKEKQKDHAGKDQIDSK